MFFIFGPAGSVWYKGYKLDLRWLLDNCKSLRKITKARAEDRGRGRGRSRTFVICKTCQDQEEAASRVSANGIVYAASGMRADGAEKLRKVVDHLLGRPHQAAVETQELEDQWRRQTDNHPWLKITKQREASTIQILIKLAVDVYSDSMIETPSAWSWPCRSLATLHSERLLSAMADHGWEWTFTPTSPSSTDLHYRYPAVYRGMLESVAAVEAEKLSDALNKGICFSVQVDGSVDRMQLDTKFVTARTVSESGSLSSLFLGVVESESGGAEGLLEATALTLKNAKADTDKLVGITTDGEAANTGRSTGLWKRLEEHVKHKLLVMWCVCHRSDLAVENAENTVPELRHWKADLLSVSSYFRSSKSRTKALKRAGGKYAFPAYFEVRFAEHLLILISAVLGNLPACREVWKEVAASNDKKAKTEAAGYLARWEVGGRSHLMTAIMADCMASVSRLQKRLQEDDLTIPDVLEARDGTITYNDVLGAYGERPSPRWEGGGSAVVRADRSRN